MQSFPRIVSQGFHICAFAPDGNNVLASLIAMASDLHTDRYLLSTVIGSVSFGGWGGGG